MLALLSRKKWDRCGCKPECRRWWMHTGLGWPMNVAHIDEFRLEGVALEANREKKL